MELTKSRLRKLIIETLNDDMLINEGLADAVRAGIEKVKQAGGANSSGVIPSGSPNSYGYIRGALGGKTGRHYIIQDGGYEYVLFLKNHAADYLEAEDGRTLADIPGEQTPIAITKSPQDDKISRQKPFAVTANVYPKEFKAIRNAFISKTKSLIQKSAVRNRQLDAEEDAERAADAEDFALTHDMDIEAVIAFEDLPTRLRKIMTEKIQSGFAVDEADKLRRTETYSSVYADDFNGFLDSIVDSLSALENNKVKGFSQLDFTKWLFLSKPEFAKQILDKSYLGEVLEKWFKNNTSGRQKLKEQDWWDDIKPKIQTLHNLLKKAGFKKGINTTRDNF